ncbi:MAG: response regulator transcription factor [Actinobacteria bacterium]|nr:response regulator transcription factor [Actinomycetota bacterium]
MPTAELELPRIADPAPPGPVTTQPTPTAPTARGPRAIAPRPAPAAEALPDASVRALVVDSHAPSRIGLGALLEAQPWIERCLLAADSGESVALARRHRPDVAILDISQTGPFAGSVTAAIRAAHPGVQILLTSRCRTSPGAPPAALGAVGFLPAGVTPEDLIDTVRTAVIGGEPLDLADPTPTGALELTEREREILILLATGATNREIAERLHLGPDSIKKSATVLYRKLGVRNRTEAARRAELVLGRGLDLNAA